MPRAQLINWLQEDWKELGMSVPLRLKVFRQFFIQSAWTRAGGNPAVFAYAEELIGE